MSINNAKIVKIQVPEDKLEKLKKDLQNKFK